MASVLRPVAISPRPRSFPAPFTASTTNAGMVREVQLWSRMKRNATALALLSITIMPTFAQLPEDLKRKFDEAERRIVRLSPTAFPELPRNVVRELHRRGCTIPQPYTNRKANVIRGEFAKPGQTDWAALCYCKGTLGLYVFLNGSDTDVAVVGQRQFPAALAGPFEAAIAPVNGKYIVDHYRAYGGPKPPPIDHQGIEWSSGMASEIL